MADLSFLICPMCRHEMEKLKTVSLFEGPEKFSFVYKCRGCGLEYSDNWILCSELEPNENAQEWYIVTERNEQGVLLVKAEKWMGGGEGNGGYWKTVPQSHTVLAWQPMPYPCKRANQL